MCVLWCDRGHTDSHFARTFCVEPLSQKYSVRVRIMVQTLPHGRLKQNKNKVQCKQCFPTHRNSTRSQLCHIKHQDNSPCDPPANELGEFQPNVVKEDTTGRGGRSTCQTVRGCFNQDIYSTFIDLLAQGWGLPGLCMF